MAERFEVHGLKEVNNLLKDLPEKVEKRILRSMVRAGAQVVRKAAVANLDGGTNNDIILKPSRSKSRAKKAIIISVGPTKEKFYLKFLELGTKPHVIRRDQKKILSTGEEIFGVEVQHPGQAAEPFLRPALDENVDKVIEAMAKQGAKRIEKEAAKR